MKQSKFSLLQTKTLVKLRYFAAFGQLTTVIAVKFILDFDFAYLACFGVIFISLALNIWLQRNANDLTERKTTIILAIDIILLAALLFLTGGLQNPFALLFIGPVLIAAATQAATNIIILGLLVTLLSSFLALYHLPLPWHEGQALILPPLWNFGFWLSIQIAMVFTSLFAFRATSQSRELDAALRETELIFAREQKMTALDGLAAAAAHELGTPLATIALVSKELEKEISAIENLNEQDKKPLLSDISLLKEQTKRCRDILGKLNQLSHYDAPYDKMSIEQLIEELTSPYSDVDIKFNIQHLQKDKNFYFQRSPLILYGLGNIIENAIDFAKHEITITTKIADDLTIIISDDGDGFASEIIEKIGQPYISKRGNHRKMGVETAEGEGLGLGVFIAKTFLARTGANLLFYNSKSPHTGANVEIIWKEPPFISSTV